MCGSFPLGLGLLFLLMVVITVCSANGFKCYLILSDINILFYPADAVNLSGSGSHFTEDSQRPLTFFCCGNEYCQKADSFLYETGLCCFVFWESQVSLLGALGENLCQLIWRNCARCCKIHLDILLIMPLYLIILFHLSWSNTCNIFHILSWNNSGSLCKVETDTSNNQCCRILSWSCTFHQLGLSWWELPWILLF